MLETYEATRFIKVLESGRTRPILLECELADENGISVGDFVVKAIGLPEVEEYGLFAETLGYLVAAELDIETPKPAIVRLSNEFVAAVNPVVRSKNMSLRAGVGFGSEHLGSGLVSASADQSFVAEQTVAALNIFCYDLLIQNFDRLERNPNCLIKNGRIIAFDFNVAFSFLLLIGNVDEPWEVSKHRSESQHLFHRALKGKNLDFKPFIERVIALSTERVDEILDAIPFGDGRWNDRIRDHFHSIRENAEKLEIEFARSLL